MDEQNIDTNQGDQNSSQSELELLKAESQKNLNGWMRAQADFENYQKREEGRRGEIVEFAREVAVVKLLPSLDTIRQALEHAPVEQNQESRIKNQEFFEKYDKWLNGIHGTLKQLEKALEELGVKKIQTLGQKFDPNKHEAVREVPGEEDGLIVEEYQIGYEINGKIIRPPQVVISKKS